MLKNETKEKKKVPWDIADWMMFVHHFDQKLFGMKPYWIFYALIMSWLNLFCVYFACPPCAHAFLGALKLFHSPKTC